MKARGHFDFCVIVGGMVREIIYRDLDLIVEKVRSAYLAHGNGQTVNPFSTFLQFPGKNRERIIALPAYIGDGYNIAGIKWIASFPENIQKQIPRASSVLILNDCDTGYPVACLESSTISAARTAASAVLAAEKLNGSKVVRRAGFIGNGVICRYILDFLVRTRWTFDEIILFDLERRFSESLEAYIRSSAGLRVRIESSAEAVVRNSDLVTFATTAVTPHIHDAKLFSHCPIVLNVSLRDLGPSVILSANNIVDDVEHCLRANTSPHLAEQQCGHRRFISSTIDELLRNSCRLEPGKPAIFSPFGMGILDLVVGHYVYQQAVLADRVLRVNDFFPAQQGEHSTP